MNAIICKDAKCSQNQLFLWRSCFFHKKSLLCIYSWTPWIQNVSTHIDGQDNRKKVASKVNICLISPRISPHRYWGLVLSDMICLVRMLLIWEAGVTKLSYCDYGDVTRGQHDGRPVWLEMPRQQRHRYISITQRKSIELLKILPVITRHHYWMVALFSMHSNTTDGCSIMGYFW